MASKRVSGGNGSKSNGKVAPGRPRIRSSHSASPKGEGEATEPRKRPKSAAAARPKASPSSRVRKPRPSPAAAASGSIASDEARELAVAIAGAAIEKKAVGLEILDVAGRVDYADFLVLMTGRSDRQVAALAQGIEEALRRLGRRPLSVEGLPHANWVLIDFGDVVVHVFQDDARSLYDLEGLWMDARRIPVPLPDAPQG